VTDEDEPQRSVRRHLRRLLRGLEELLAGDLGVAQQVHALDGDTAGDEVPVPVGGGVGGAGDVGQEHEIGRAGDDDGVVLAVGALRRRRRCRLLQREHGPEKRSEAHGKA